MKIYLREHIIEHTNMLRNHQIEHENLKITCLKTGVLNVQRCKTIINVL